MQKFKNNHPRCWAIGMFVPMLLITFVVAPIGYLVDVVKEIPTLLNDLWIDFQIMFVDTFKRNGRSMAYAWHLWFNSLCGRVAPKSEEKRDELFESL